MNWDPTLAGFLYLNSAYGVIGEPIPECFLRLCDRYATKVPIVHHPIMHFAAALAHGLCIRIADVDYYTRRINDVLAADRGPATATEAGSLLVGHFGSCKAVLDAGAIAVTMVYSLRDSKGAHLREREQDFRKGAFFATLQREQPGVAARYSPLRTVIVEISEWRDAVVHRTAPLVLPRQEWDQESQTYRIAGYRMALDKNPSTADVFGHRPIEWVHPLHFHQRWRLDLLAFCAEVCRDLESTI